MPPIVIGGALVISNGFLDRLKGESTGEPDEFARETARIEKMAMDTIIEIERKLGYEPRNVSGEECGYDVESKIQEKGCLRMRGCIFPLCSVL